MNPARRSRHLRLAAAISIALIFAFGNARAELPVYVAETGAANPFNGIDVGGFVAPALADLDADGDLDFLAGERNGAFFYFENAGTPTDPVYVARTGAADPFDAIDALSNPAPGFADLDADGDLDLVTGGSDGLFRYFENTGTLLVPIFSERTGIENPLDAADVGNFSTATFADVDEDGDFDFVSGISSGAFAWFENTGTATSPSFSQRSGDESPLFGFNAGLFSTPTFAGLDGDGAADLVSGVAPGRFAFFRAPEPDAMAMTCAALVALSMLAKRCERRALR